MLETRNPGSPEFQKSPCSGGSMECLLDLSEPRGSPCGNGPGRIRGARTEAGLTGLGFSRQGSYAMEGRPRIPGRWARIVAAAIAGLVLSGCQEQGEESARSAAIIRFVRADDESPLGADIPVDMSILDNDWNPAEVEVPAEALIYGVQFEIQFISDSTGDSYSGLSLDNFEVSAN